MLRRTFLTSSLALAAMTTMPRKARSVPLAPFGLYDTHAHFYSNDAVKYPFRATITPAARAKAMEHPITPHEIFRMWDDVGVEMGCGVQYNTTYSTDNRYLLDIADDYPARISPVVILDPADPATPAALKSMARANGISGVRFSGDPDAQGDFLFLGAAAREAWDMANELELVVVLMPRRSVQPRALPAAMKRIGALAEEYPRINIVIDHIGYPVAERTPTFGFSPEHLALAGRKNVFYKYTTFLMDVLQREGGVPAKDFLNYVVEVYGADHLVWGSDVGNSAGPFRAIVQRALDSAEGLSLAQKRSIFYDTAKGLFIAGGRAGRPPRCAKSTTSQAASQRCSR